MGLWKKIFSNKKADSVDTLRDRLDKFQHLVEKNNQVLELIADAGEKLGGEYIFDIQYLRTLADELAEAIQTTVANLNALTSNRYPELVAITENIKNELQAILESRVYIAKTDITLPIESINEELSDVVGQKMARLGEIKKRMGCLVPDGFTISAYACQRFCSKAGIDQKIEELFPQTQSQNEVQLDEKSKQLQEQLSQATLPREISRAIRRAGNALKKKTGGQILAVRSSALGEDGERSFAGQYRTLLGVPYEKMQSAYKEVLNSLYSASVMKYRLEGGMHPAQGLMAVGFLCLIPARASGVLYTLDPLHPQNDRLVVSSVWGLGKAVVDGTGVVDRFELSRHHPHKILTSTIANKDTMLVVQDGKSVNKVQVPENQKKASSISQSQLIELTETALRIEKYMKCAQDIEWAVDPDGRIVILQARPLRIVSQASSANRNMTEVTGNYPVLLNNQGEVACRGIGAGRVHIVNDEDELQHIAKDVVLVAKTSTPRLAAAMTAANAVLTDVGTATGHLAAIAREYRLPTIVDTQVATQVLKDTQEVTVDAEENLVYQGRVTELLHYQLLRSSSYEDTFEYRLLRNMLKKIATLNLQDPQATNFTSTNCRTYHDIIRFAHEKAVELLTLGTWVTPSPTSQYVRRLKLEIPIDLILIDIGGGLVSQEGTRTIVADNVTSIPMRALLEGLTTKGVWATDPADMDLSSFMSSATRATLLTHPLSTRPEQNLAIISKNYMNLSLKLGYHFNIVDCYLTEIRNDNLIYFRFAGGVTELARRSRRARVLKRILRKHDFIVEGKGDLVIGRIKKIPYDDMLERLTMLGRLIGFTRQLDIFLKDDSLVERFEKNFLEGNYNPFSR